MINIHHRLMELSSIARKKTHANLKKISPHTQVQGLHHSNPQLKVRAKQNRIE